MVRNAAAMMLARGGKVVRSVAASTGSEILKLELCGIGEEIVNEESA